MAFPRAAGPDRNKVPNSPYQITSVDEQDRLRIPPADLASVAQHALEVEGATRAILEIVLVDDSKISELHLRFMGDPTSTDVITFPHDDEFHSGDTPVSTEEGLQTVQGEIVISTETAVRQSQEHDTHAEYETLLYVVHGVLHLLGYDDHEEEQFKVMALRQSQILDSWWSQHRGR